jgi:hypothetical protein
MKASEFYLTYFFEAEDFVIKICTRNTDLFRPCNEGEFITCLKSAGLVKRVLRYMLGTCL